jgi:hypothetical protein
LVVSGASSSEELDSSRSSPSSGIGGYKENDG